MTRLALACLPLALAALPLCADVPVTEVMGPVYGQIVVLPAPQGFAPANEQSANGYYLLELPAKGETLDAWTQLMTMTGSEGLAKQADVARYAQVFAKGYRDACPETFTAIQVDLPRFKGARAQAGLWLGCGTAGGQRETVAVVIFEAGDNLYTLQWAERGPAEDSAPQPDWATWDPRFGLLAQGRVCPQVAGEALPYPSCKP